MESERPPQHLSRAIDLEDLCALIGNIIRLTVAVETTAARAAADAAASTTLHAALFEPRLSPSCQRDDIVNRMLLEAFVTFRAELEVIRAMSSTSATEH